MDFETVIGMEVHTELQTRSKVFCGCSTAFGSAPNTQVCPVCLGMPGVLPVLNRTALEYTIRTAIALNCKISENTIFDRKNYYYPDLPKNYQISQNYACLGYNGWVDLQVGGRTVRISIHNVHLEEDAGKNVHPETGDAEEYSLVDLNRTGMPLIEIVSGPDMRSADEALAYMITLKNLLEYLGVSDCRMQEGHLRFEVNISLRPAGSTTLGKRVEIKNLASMQTALKCIEHEQWRQAEVLSSGGRVEQETRLWDEAAAQTRSMRSKEDAQDYRYFPDPDLVEVHITPDWIERVRADLPELQAAKKDRFLREYGIPEYDAGILTASRPLADYFEHCISVHNNPKSASNWIMTEILREMNSRGMEISDCPVTPEHLGIMIRMIDDNTISGKIAKMIFPEMMETGRGPGEIVKEKGLVQITSEDAIAGYCDEVIRENMDAVENIRAGKDKALAFLVGQVMKKSRGKANPQIVNRLLLEKIQGAPSGQ